MAASGCFLVAAVLGLADDAPPRPTTLPGEKFTPPAMSERQKDKLAVSDAAPDFTLKDLSGKNDIKLSSLKGKKPVVLIFGSCT
jgi:hypothetical protein